MLRLRNEYKTLKEFFVAGEKIVFYGAGNSTKILLKSYHEILKDKLMFIVDIKEELDGTYCEAGGDTVRVISLSHFCQMPDLKQYTLLMTPYSVFSIIKRLDEIQQLDGVSTYVYPLLVNNKPPQEFSFKSTPEPIIPKVIHYFWIGEKNFPDEYKKNVESWKRFCPDYEIKLWNESNYDFHANRYTYEALKTKNYMYATDYARKDILYRYGGIYIDTDVEILRSFDSLLYNEAFVGIDDGGQINSGSALGAVKGHPVIKGMMESYRDLTFIREDGGFHTSCNVFYETEYMISKGYEVKNEYQNICGIRCFPREVFMPESLVGLYDNYTERTLSSHRINPYDKTERRKVLARIS